MEFGYEQFGKGVQNEHKSEATEIRQNECVINLIVLLRFFCAMSGMAFIYSNF